MHLYGCIKRHVIWKHTTLLLDEKAIKKKKKKKMKGNLIRAVYTYHSDILTF